MKISVAMITYNHEAYIEQAVESVMQQTGDFELELIIGEDNSKDNTRALVQRLANQYPDKIKLLLWSPNIGMMPNFVKTLDACTGQYVAILEGDDYWTDPLKLQKQLDYMQAHPACAMCYHNANVLIIETGQTHPANTHTQQVGGLKDLILATDFAQMMTGSMFYRNTYFNALPSWLVKQHAGDRALPIILATYGEIHYNPAIMSVYRKHQGGISVIKQANYFKKGNLNLLNTLKKELPAAMRPFIKQRRSDVYLQWAIDYRRYYKAFFTPLRYFILSLWYNMSFTRQQFKSIIADDLFYNLHKRLKNKR